MATSAACVTVKVVEFETPPKVAVMLEVPVASVAASPVPLMVATLVLAEAQVTVFVMSAVDESVYVPVAVNCWAKPFATEGFGGAMVIEAREIAFTLRIVDPVIELNVAPMFV